MINSFDLVTYGRNAADTRDPTDLVIPLHCLLGHLHLTLQRELNILVAILGRQNSSRRDRLICRIRLVLACVNSRRLHPCLDLAPLQMLLLPLLLVKAINAAWVGSLQFVLVLWAQLVVMGSAVFFTYEVVDGEMLVQMVMAEQPLVDRIIDAALDGRVDVGVRLARHLRLLLLSWRSPLGRRRYIKTLRVLFMDDLLLDNLLILIRPTLIRTAKMMYINVIIVINNDNLPTVPNRRLLLVYQLVDITRCYLRELALLYLVHLPVARLGYVDLVAGLSWVLVAQDTAVEVVV